MEFDELVRLAAIISPALVPLVGVVWWQLRERMSAHDKRVSRLEDRVAALEGAMSRTVDREEHRDALMELRHEIRDVRSDVKHGVAASVAATSELSSRIDLILRVLEAWKKPPQG